MGISHFAYYPGLVLTAFHGFILGFLYLEPCAKWRRSQHLSPLRMIFLSDYPKAVCVPHKALYLKACLLTVTVLTAVPLLLQGERNCLPLLKSPALHLGIIL